MSSSICRSTSCSQGHGHSPQASHEVPSQEVSLSRLNEVDFSNIKTKLQMPQPEGMGWTLEQVELAEKWYRRFLTLHIKFPSGTHVPNEIIDTFWHAHILDTHAYETDCRLVFGRFVHHFPYYGIRGENDRAARDNSFVETNKQYMELFGEDCCSMDKLFSRKPNSPRARECASCAI